MPKSQPGPRFQQREGPLRVGPLLDRGPHQADAEGDVEDGHAERAQPLRRAGGQRHVGGEAEEHRVVGDVEGAVERGAVAVERQDARGAEDAGARGEHAGRDAELEPGRPFRAGLELRREDDAARGEERHEERAGARAQQPLLDLFPPAPREHVAARRARREPVQQETPGHQEREAGEHQQEVRRQGRRRSASAARPRRRARTTSHAPGPAPQAPPAAGGGHARARQRRTKGAAGARRRLAAGRASAGSFASCPSCPCVGSLRTPSARASAGRGGASCPPLGGGAQTIGEARSRRTEPRPRPRPEAWLAEAAATSRWPKAFPSCVPRLLEAGRLLSPSIGKVHHVACAARHAPAAPAAWRRRPEVAAARSAPGWRSVGRRETPAFAGRPGAAWSAWKMWLLRAGDRPIGDPAHGFERRPTRTRPG